MFGLCIKCGIFCCFVPLNVFLNRIKESTAQGVKNDFTKLEALFLG